MRLKTKVRSTLTAGAALVLALGLGSCSRSYVVSYVYSVSAASATISGYAVDFQTGIPNQIAGSPFTSTVSEPLKIVSHPNNEAVYIVGGPNGSQGNAVETALVGSDGKLYGATTVNLTGTEGPGTSNQPTPVGMAVDKTGTFLYVTFTYQNGFSTASPGPGGVTIFKINQNDNTLSTVGTVNVGNDPVSVAVSAPVCVPTPLVSSNPTCSTGSGTGAYNVYVYVVDQEVKAGAPTVLGYAQNMTTGALTPLSQTRTTTGGLLQGVSAGVTPSDVAVDGSASFVYVTDRETNQIYGYNIARNTTGNLTAMPSSPFSTGALPLNVVVDPRAQYVYTANFNGPSVSAFAINRATGSLSAVAGSTFATHSGTNCIAIDPNLGTYLYATNLETNNIDGAHLDNKTGVLTAIANTPFPTGSLPSCLAAVGNGSHAINLTFPATGVSN